MADQDTIKTQVLEALESALKAEIPLLKTVEGRDPVPTDLETTPMPALFLYEQDETQAKRNRLALETIRVEMAGFFRLNPPGKKGFKGFYALADRIAGMVDQVIQKSPALGGLVIQAQRDLKRPAIANETFGELILIYRITYGHAWGNAFTQAY